MAGAAFCVDLQGGFGGRWGGPCAHLVPSTVELDSALLVLYARGWIAFGIFAGAALADGHEPKPLRKAIFTAGEPTP